MIGYQSFSWQEIVVCFILGLVILALLHYIGRRLKLLKKVVHKNSGSCTSCQGCPHSLEHCESAENQKNRRND